MRLVMPLRCPSCSIKDALIPMTRMIGQVVELTWLCRECRHEWNVTRDDLSQQPVH
jgi:hypothetical protein